MEEDRYVPGVCNIGKSERLARRQAGMLGLLLTLIFIGMLISQSVPYFLQNFGYFSAAR